MRAVSESSRTAVPPQGSPKLDSYDSGEEFSIRHWVKVCALMDDSDAALAEESAHAGMTEEVLTETTSEVEPATAY